MSPASPRVAACVLAAGEGRRMGSPKAFALLDGRTFVEHWLQSLRDAGIGGSTWVVAAPATESLRSICDAFRANLLVNTAPERGMLSSLHVCLHAIRAAASPPPDALLVAPVDCPRVRAETIAALVRAFATSRAPIVVPRHAGRRGHPVLFASGLFDELLAAPLEVGARAVVRAHASDRLELDVDDPAVLDDLDTPAALDAARDAARNPQRVNSVDSFDPQSGERGVEP